LAVFPIIIIQFSSNILDFVQSKNKSRPHRLQIETEYLLDQKKFFHLTAAILIGKVALVAIGAMFIAFFNISVECLQLPGMEIKVLKL